MFQQKHLGIEKASESWPNRNKSFFFFFLKDRTTNEHQVESRCIFSIALIFSFFLFE